MKKVLSLFAVLFSVSSFSQNIFFDNFSTFNLSKIDGQAGYSSATPSLGNGSGSCFGPSCLPVTIVTQSMGFQNFGTCTQALNPVDGVLATGDGPGKSVGKAVTSGTIYLAMLVNFSTPSSSTSPTGSKQVVRLMDNSFTVAGRIYIKQVTGGVGYQIGINKNGSSANFAASTYSYDQDHLLILKYNFIAGSTTNDVVSVFVDPDLSQVEPSATLSMTGATDATSITRIVFPWNATSLTPKGYIGIVSVSTDWSNLVPPAPTTFSITGRTASVNQFGINKTKVNLKNTTVNDSIIASKDGNFSFSNLSTADYVLRPTKNNDSLKNNGVTVIDAILVQSHILNKVILNSPYKIIAADVNNSGDVSAIDILYIKRLVLGIDTTFKGNRLWAFVDSAYQFPDTTNPFPFKDSIRLNSLAANQINQSFIGVKLGDVNYDWDATVMGNSTKRNTPIEFYYPNVQVENNAEIRIPISVKNFKNMLGMQYTLNFNNKALELKGIEQNKLNIEYGIQKASEGKISFLWNDEKGIAKSLADNSVLMELVFTKKAAFTQEDLILSNDIASIEAWDGNLQKHAIVKTSGSIQQKQESVIAKESWEVVPNPTKDGKVKVSINLQSTKEIELKLTSIDGKLLMQQKLSGKKGLNTYTINLQSQMKLAKGVYYLQANGFEGEKVKVIVIE